MLKEIHNHHPSDAQDLLKTAERAEKKAKLSSVKRKVFQKAQELHGAPETNGGRKPIPDDVKMFVCNRDGGKCLNCRNRDALEFDHIIPVVKGGANAGRNIQLLGEKCNGIKSDSIV
ncbi:MAG: HNH endonuclease [Smithella sp.]